MTDKTDLETITAEGAARLGSVLRVGFSWVVVIAILGLIGYGIASVVASVAFATDLPNPLALLFHLIDTGG